MTRLHSVCTILTFVFCLPLVAHAELININTADAAALDTLPGIGPSKATAIIDYRNLNGPFATIENIQDVSGIGPSTFANIQSLITVGGTAGPATVPTSASVTTSTVASTPTQTTSSVTTSVPVSTRQARIDAGTDRSVIVGADTVYTAAVYDAEGKLRTDATVTWSFGDGMSANGAHISHTYYAQGDYAVVVEATLREGVQAVTSLVVNAAPLAVRVAAVSTMGISLQNTSTQTLDLSNWQLMSGGQVFSIPINTRILGGKTITFAPQVTRFLFVPTAELRFPNGTLAVSGPTVAPVTPIVKPSPPAPALSKVQAVETVPNAVTSTTHGTEAVRAPAAQASLAAAGAAVQPISSTTPTERRASLISSPWSWGLIGTLVISAGAFILL